MSQPFRIFASVQTLDGVIEYKHIGDGVEYLVDGKRFTRLKFREQHRDGELVFWTDDDPPSFPITDSPFPLDME